MPTVAADPITLELSSRSGLRASLNRNGSLRRLDYGAIALSLFVGNEIEGGPANLYLRRHAARIEGPPSSALPVRPASVSMQVTGHSWDAVAGATSAI